MIAIVRQVLSQPEVTHHADLLKRDKCLHFPDFSWPLFTIVIGSGCSSISSIAARIDLVFVKFLLFPDKVEAGLDARFERVRLQHDHSLEEGGPVQNALLSRITIAKEFCQ